MPGRVRVRAPIPDPWVQPWMNAIGIVSLVYAWAGFVGMLLGLYLLSAEVWAEQDESGWSIALLAGIGLCMMVLGTVAFILSRRGWMWNSLYALLPAIATQLAGGITFGLLELPFAVEAAAAVLGLQVLPALVVLAGYFVFEWYRDSLARSG